MMPAIGNGVAEAPIELSVGACAKIARKSREDIDGAMRRAELYAYRDRNGVRVTTLPALIEWMRAHGLTGRAGQ